MVGRIELVKLRRVFDLSNKLSISNTGLFRAYLDTRIIRKTIT